MATIHEFPKNNSFNLREAAKEQALLMTKDYFDLDYWPDFWQVVGMLERAYIIGFNEGVKKGIMLNDKN